MVLKNYKIIPLLSPLLKMKQSKYTYKFKAFILI